MTALEMPVNETKRIEALKRYSILDTPPDGAFDHITELAASIFNVPIAIISLVDTDRIWFKSHFGLSINQINRDPGLCASAILSTDLYVVENAATDPRSLANPLVAGEFGLRFYAAAPLFTEDHYSLGTLCILDKSPRNFTEEQKGILSKLSKIVMDEMELRLSLRNTVEKIKNISADVTAHLKFSIQKIESINAENQKANLLAYLESSQFFMMNMQNELNQF
jgi:GAF domain-containing protein